MDITDNLTPIKFYFYSLKFTPYKDASEENSTSILKKVISYISIKKSEGKGHLIDRNRTGLRGKERNIYDWSYLHA